MTKAKYTVVIDYIRYHYYVTTTRNSEDMINLILEKHQTFSPRQVIIYREMEGETQVIYSLKPLKNERISNFG